MARRGGIPEYGVEVIEGRPGAGKSLVAVKRAIEAAAVLRRPVYTNLPLRWPVVRAYLANRGGPNVAQLIRPLTQEHFTRFIERFAAYVKATERWKGEAKARGEPLSTPMMMRRWRDEAGDDICDGEDANWIPAGAIVCLDEVHVWYPARDQSKEPPSLYAYLSKHRHMCHWIWAIAQDRMTLSISFRRLCTKFWAVRDMRQDKLAWGIRFGHLGIHAIGYSAYTGDQAEGKSTDNATPIANFVTIPWLPSNARYFRFYDSFSHVGKLGALTRQMEESRKAAGLSADGSDVADDRVLQHRRRERQRRFFMVGRILRLVRWCIIRTLVVGAIGSVAFAIGRVGGRPAAVSQDKAIAAVAESAGEVNEAPVVWPKWEGVGRDYVRIGGERVRVGDRVGELSLVHMSARPRALVVECRGALWVWKWGQPEPDRVGTSNEVRGVLEARRAAFLRAASERGASESGGGELGPADGDAFGG